MPVRVVLFDFFGTLVAYNASRREQGYHGTHELLREFGASASYDEFLDAWELAFAVLDRDTADDHREYSMEDGAAPCLAAVLGRQPTAPEIDAVVDSYLAEWNTGVEYLDGVAAMIDELSGSYRLAVVTNTHHPRLVPDHLAVIGILDRFQAVITSVELGWRKPHPSMYTAALDVLAASPTDVAFVGDTFDADYLGPRAAGIAAFLIDPDGRHDIDARHRLTSVLDVADVLR